MESSRLKTYFVSDVHLGGCGYEGAEERFLKFLRSLPEDTGALYMLGDIFDFWAEYDDVVPRGYVRVLGELARLADAGVELWLFKGNHDWWLKDFLQKDIGVKVVAEPYVIKEIGGRRFCLGHGDGIGKLTFGERFIYKMFRNKVLIALLRLVDPRLVIKFAGHWSGGSRSKHSAYTFRGRDDRLYKAVNEIGRGQNIDYYVFGHIHTAAVIDVESGGELHVLGDWSADGDHFFLF
jgi:Uncharacterized protein conserved in bacteria